MSQTPISPSLVVNPSAPPKQTKKKSTSTSRTPRSSGSASTMTTTTSENVANSIQQGVSPDTPTVITLKSLEQVDPLAEAVSSRPKLKHVKASDAGATKPLQAEEYFHGYLPAEAAQKTLSNKGDFLVRKVVVDRGREELLLSLVAGDLKVKHLKVIHSILKKVYFLHNFCFDSPAGMIAYHLRKKIPVNTEGDLITKGVAREAWQLYHEQLYRRKKLGDGAFGEVWFGTLYQGIFKKTEVAIKMPLGKVTASEHEKLFQEAQLMRTLDHPHCIKLIGVAMYDEPLMIVMELAHGGSVLDAVKKKPGPSQEERIKYSIGALKGLAFLESRLVIHRDIAARNTLISAKGEAKISDFGLSILGAEHKEKRLQKVPVRYLAPETLSSGKYSSKSDVWSFGILLWEIFYDGREPYEDIVDPVEVKKQVKQGRHLLNSTNSCPKHLWDVATLCWTVKPDQRPSFAELMTTLGISDSPAPTRLVDQIAHKLHIGLKLHGEELEYSTKPYFGKLTNGP